MLLLVPDPRVKDRFELGLDGILLSEDKVLVLELIGLLGDGVKRLGEGNDLLELADGVDSVGDGTGVLLTGRVEDGLDLFDLALRPLGIRGRDGLADNGSNDKETDEQDSLLVGNLRGSSQSRVLPNPFIPTSLSGFLHFSLPPLLCPINRF